MLTEGFLQGRPIEIGFQFCRQTGKTESIADWLAFMYSIGYRMAGKPFKAVVFAPTRDQARNDFTRFKFLLRKWETLLGKREVYESTKTKVEDFDGNCVFVLPLTNDVDIEGASANVLLYEEAQGIDDEAMENKAAPMGANFGAPQFFIGTAGTKICKFYSLIAKKQAVNFNYKDVSKIKEEQYKLDGNKNHLRYLEFVEKMKSTQNTTSFERQFMNKWSIGESQFMTMEEFEACSTEKSHFSIFQTGLKIIYSLDQARTIDSAILKKVLYDPVSMHFESVAMWTLPSYSYAKQRDWLKDFFKSKPYDIFIIDTTGNQTALPDFLIAEGITDKNKTIYFNFSGTHKHEIFTLFESKIRDREFHFFRPTRQERFEHIMLQKKYDAKGLMKVEAPKKKGYHDDIPCANAMAVYAGLNLQGLRGSRFSIA